MRAFLIFGVLLLASAPAWASETITYTYDALGRLVKVARTGTVNQGANACYTYDPANNRTNTTSAPSADCTPGSGGQGGGGGGNQPPTPVNDVGSQQKCTTAVYNVTANDTDPEGNYPLVVTAVSGPAGFSVISSTQIQYESPGTTGPKVATYTVRDSLNATATATLTVTVSGGQCQ